MLLNTPGEVVLLNEICVAGAALRIVRGHHGAIRIESALGKGSVFEVLIPAAPDRERKKALTRPLRHRATD
jgi:hypothetical protein